MIVVKSTAETTKYRWPFAYKDATDFTHFHIPFSKGLSMGYIGFLVIAFISVVGNNFLISLTVVLEKIVILLLVLSYYFVFVLF